MISEVISVFQSIAKSGQDILNFMAENVHHVSSTAEESTVGSEEILESVKESSKSIKEIAESAQMQAELADKLSNMVKRFKI